MLAVFRMVPMSRLSAIAGVSVTRGDNNTFTQIGLVVLVGLACKNAILIGLVLTPVFYVVIQGLVERGRVPATAGPRQREVTHA